MQFTPEEIEIAENLKKLIETYGLKDLLKWEFQVGIYSNEIRSKVFAYLKNWNMIQEVIEFDKNESEKPLFSDSKPQKNTKPRKTFDKALERRISNAFDLAEIRKLKIKHMDPEEAEKLVIAREQERMNGRK